MLIPLVCCSPPNGGDVEEQAPAALPDSELIAKVKQFSGLVLPGEPIEILSKPRVPAEKAGNAFLSDRTAAGKGLFNLKKGASLPEPTGDFTHIKSFWLDQEGKQSPPWIMVDATTGIILSYYDYSVLGRGDEAGSVQDSNAPDLAVVPKERAFERAKPLLEFFGQPSNIEDYSVVKEAGNLWKIERRFSYNGKPFLGKVLSIQISASSGRVGMIYYRPIVEVPNAVSAPISKEKALKAATRSMKKNDFFKWRLFGFVTVDYDVKLDDISTIIALPEANQFMTRREKSAIAKLSPAEPRYCWCVRFMSTEKHPG
ncbi:MAG TPA: hypothetical protein VMV42_00805, partial [archaeon]|nr:hypothetical protein [archaeon]